MTDPADRSWFEKNGEAGDVGSECVDTSSLGIYTPLMKSPIVHVATLPSAIVMANILILVEDVGGSRATAYNECMNAAASSPEQDADTYVSMSDAAIEALGTVLAAISRLIEAEAMRHRGGPGMFRRLASIIAAFIALVVTLVVRQRAIATRSLATVTASRPLRHLRRPPQGWAAP